MFKTLTTIYLGVGFCIGATYGVSHYREHGVQDLANNLFRASVATTLWPVVI
jgi:hypothetical protein